MKLKLFKSYICFCIFVLVLVGVGLCLRTSPTVSVLDKTITNEGYVELQLGDLRFGEYKVRIKYHSAYEAEDTFYCNTIVNIMGDNLVSEESVALRSFKSSIDIPVWVTYPKGTGNATAIIDYDGNGSIEIDEVYVTEYWPWKVGALLLIASLFSIVGIIGSVLVFGDKKRKIRLLSMVLLLVVASWPCLSITWTVQGHDYLIHLSRIAALSNEMTYGNWPVFFESDAHNGYGYIMSIMYPDLFLYIPALFCLLGAYLNLAYNLYVVLVTLVTIIICLYSFKKIFGDGIWVDIATVIYVLAPFRLMDIYIRAAVGEYTAMAFLPLIAYGLWRIYFENTNNNSRLVDSLPLIIGVTGIVQSHVISIKMLAVFVVIFAIINVRLTIANAILLVKTALVVIVVNLSLLVPFIDVMSGGININKGDEYTLFSTINIPKFNLIEWKNIFEPVQNTCSDDLGVTTQSIGFSFELLIILFVIVIIRRIISEKKDNRIKEYAKQCAGIINAFLLGIIALCICTSLWPFAGITEVQFNWRYLAIATVLFTLCGCWAIRECKWQKLSIAVILLVIAFQSVLFLHGYMENKKWNIVSLTNRLVEDDLYMPIDSIQDYSNAEPVLISGDATVKNAGTDEDNHRSFYVSSLNADDGNSVVSLPVINYKHMVVVDKDNRVRFDVINGKGNLINVIVPEDYDGIMVARLQPPVWWNITYFISVAGIGCLVIYCYRMKKYRVDCK